MKHSEAEIKRLIEAAVTKIASREQRTLFVTQDRARNKAYRLAPTDNQTKLFNWIKANQPISFEETLGMNWVFLGGLFSRHLIEWQKEQLVVKP
jgi:hypothetical protein